MRLYQIEINGELRIFNTLPEAFREWTIAGSNLTDFVEIDIPEPTSSRRYSMSPNPPPEDFRWTHATGDIGDIDGDGTVTTGYIETKKEWRRIRRTFLNQFILSVSEDENGYRIWRWTDPKTNRVVWSERRKINEPLPHEPGFWPDNGGLIQ